MNIVTLLFYFFGGVTAITAIALVFVRNIFHAALLFILCLLALAGIYVMAFAEFVAVTQILIYAGGIVVLIIFGIMLTVRTNKTILSVHHTNRIAGILTGTVLVVLLVNVFSNTHWFNSTESMPDNITAIGKGLMVEYVLPFEASGILLIIALVGAAITASSFTKKKSDA